MYLCDSIPVMVPDWKSGFVGKEDTESAAWSLTVVILRKPRSSKLPLYSATKSGKMIILQGLQNMFLLILGRKLSLLRRCLSFLKNTIVKMFQICENV